MDFDDYRVGLAESAATEIMLKCAGVKTSSRSLLTNTPPGDFPTDLMGRSARTEIWQPSGLDRFGSSIGR